VHHPDLPSFPTRRSSDLIPKVDILVALEAFFKEVKTSLVEGEPVYVRGFGSFVLKKRAAKIGRDIKKNVAVEIPEHYIPAFRPAREFIQAVKESEAVEKVMENQSSVASVEEEG